MKTRTFKGEELVKVDFEKCNLQELLELEEHLVKSIRYMDLGPLANARMRSQLVGTRARMRHLRTN